MNLNIRTLKPFSTPSTVGDKTNSVSTIQKLCRARCLHSAWVIVLMLHTSGLTLLGRNSWVLTLLVLTLEIFMKYLIASHDMYSHLQME